MPYGTGPWGEQAQERSRRRREYFKQRQKEKLDALGIKNLVSLGYLGRQFAMERLGVVRRPDEQHGFDLYWGGMRVAVKTSGLRPDKVYRFSVWRQRGRVDLFLLLATNEERKMVKAFLVPDKEIRGEYVGIGKKSYYNQFLLGEGVKSYAKKKNIDTSK